MWRSGRSARRSGERHEALRRIRANRPLRRTLLAFALFRVAELSVWVALTAYAFEVGGIRESAALLVAQLVPAAIFALCVGALVQRVGPVRVLRAGYAVQTGGLVIAAAVLAGGGPRLIAYAGAVLAATAVSATRPSQSVLLPSVVDGPAQLTAANVVVGTIDGAAALVGPATAAVLMSLVGAWSVLAVMAGATLTAAGLVWRMHQVAPSASDDTSIAAGLRAVAGAPGPRVVVLGLGVHSILYGAIDVLAVVIAVDQLRRPEAFAGWVTAAFGAGMLVAGLASFAVLGRRRLAPGIIARGVGRRRVAGPRVGGRPACRRGADPHGRVRSERQPLRADQPHAAAADLGPRRPRARLLAGRGGPDGDAGRRLGQRAVRGPRTRDPVGSRRHRRR